MPEFERRPLSQVSLDTDRYVLLNNTAVAAPVGLSVLEGLMTVIYVNRLKSYRSLIFTSPSFLKFTYGKGPS